MNYTGGSITYAYEKQIVYYVFDKRKGTPFLLKELNYDLLMVQQVLFGASFIDF